MVVKIKEIWHKWEQYSQCEEKLKQILGVLKMEVCAFQRLDRMTVHGRTSPLQTVELEVFFDETIGNDVTL